MTTFGDIEQFFDPGLTLTVSGREYTVPLVSAEVGLWCRTIAETTREVSATSTAEELHEAGERARRRAAELPPLPGGDLLSFEQLMLGTAYGAMVADKVPDEYVRFCGKTAYVWVIEGETAARLFWESGGRPEAVGPRNRAERRAANTPTTGTGAAPAIPQPGFTSGTSSRQRSQRNGRGSRSRGRKS